MTWQTTEISDQRRILPRAGAAMRHEAGEISALFQKMLNEIRYMNPELKTELAADYNTDVLQDLVDDPGNAVIVTRDARGVSGFAIGGFLKKSEIEANMWDDPAHCLQLSWMFVRKEWRAKAVFEDKLLSDILVMEMQGLLTKKYTRIECIPDAAQKAIPGILRRNGFFPALNNMVDEDGRARRRFQYFRPNSAKQRQKMD